MATNASESQYVTFGLDDECFAVPVEVVREILDFEDVFRIPHGPDYLLGLRDVRGQGVPVIDLRLRLGMSGMAQTTHTRVLVIDVPIAGRLLTLGLSRTGSSKSPRSRMTPSKAHPISGCAGLRNTSPVSCAATVASS